MKTIFRFFNSLRWARSAGGSLHVSVWYAWRMARGVYDEECDK